MEQITVNNFDKVDLPAMKHSLLGIVVPSANVFNITYKDRLPICWETTIYHAERVKKLHPETKDLVNKALFSWTRNNQSRSWHWERLFEENRLGQTGNGVCHVVGLIDLVLKMQDMQVPIVLIHPESGLAPSIVLDLTDVLLELAVRGCDENLKVEILGRRAKID